MIRADLRREAQAWRLVKLARAELNPFRSTTQPAHLLQLVPGFVAGRAQQ